MQITWERYDHNSLDDALSTSFCLYVFYHPVDGDRPYYIGKAKYFGTNQSTGYEAAARYNGGYVHLVAGMLRSGFSLYIARLGEQNFESAESYEQELIAQWNPVRPQKRKEHLRKPVATEKPWRAAN
jgi:hypothetical protein